MNNWITYKNGNYTVKLNIADGTKIRETEDDEFISAFPENIDVKLTNKCNGMLGSDGQYTVCPYCHEASTPNGKHGVFPISVINSLHPGTELALGGGNLFEYPELDNVLELLKGRGIIANITVNQSHYIQNYNKIKDYADNKLVYGIGVSVSPSIINDTSEKVAVPLLNNNVVLHAINGLHTKDDLLSLAKQGHRKLLILGYKEIRRGKSFKEENEQLIINNSLYNDLWKLSSAFEVLSFDNLALAQLNVKRMFTPKQWEEFYMGDDGQFTMYIDLVKQEFARNSTSNIRYKLLDNVTDMFKIVKNEKV